MNRSYSKYCLNEIERSELIDRLTNLLKDDQKIIFAYLHGSFITENVFSDLDIAVYLKEMSKSELLSYELKLEELLESKLKMAVDLKSLNTASPVFAYMVIKKGIHLIVQNDQKRVEFEMRTLQNYFDILPFRRRYLQEV